MLWIALYIPELPLQIALRVVPQAGDEALSSPLVITGGADNRPVVHAANAAAKAMGIKAGISIAAARADVSGERVRVVINSHAPATTAASVDGIAAVGGNQSRAREVSDIQPHTAARSAADTENG